MARKDVLWVAKSDLNKDLTGHTYIVTGANSGVGLETTRQLIKQGAHVIMGCRRVDEATRQAQNFQSLKGRYSVVVLDLADLTSVRRFAEHILLHEPQLNGLVCNAGMINMDNTPKYTQEGFEWSKAVSYFGHFLLTELLLERLKQSASARIVLLSSVIHAGSKNQRPDIHLHDMQFNHRKYSGFQAYCEAKLMNNLYALELAERLKGTGVTPVAVHPGWARSNFGGQGWLMTLFRVLISPFSAYLTNSNEESAQTSLHCLLSDEVVAHAGAYFSQQSILYSDKDCKKGGWPMVSPNPHARDINKARELVNLSRSLVGLKASQQKITTHVFAQNLAKA